MQKLDQADLSQIEQQNEIDEDKFVKLNEKIQQFIKSHNGSTVRLEPLDCEYLYIKSKQNLGEFKFCVKTSLRSGITRINTILSLQQSWTDVTGFGIHNLYQILTTKNAHGHTSELTIELNQPHKCLESKVQYQGMYTYLIQNIIAIVSAGIKNLLEVLNVLIKWRAKQAKFQTKVQYLVEVMEQFRKQRVGSTVGPSGTRKLDRKRMDTELKTFTQNIQKQAQKLKQSFSQSPLIFRSIKQLSATPDKSWSNNDGSNSKVKKCLLSYQINDLFSINIEANKYMLRMQMEMEMAIEGISKETESVGSRSTQCTNEKEGKVVSTTLVKKIPKCKQDKSFEVEKKLLAYLRNQRCHSLNNFYCVQKNCLEQVQYLYSDFHKRKLSHSQRPKQYFKVLLTLCQGLVFLKWNGMSHRDLKPDNILLSNDNTAKMIDFGSGCHNMSFSRLREGNRKEWVAPQRLRTNYEYNLCYQQLPPEVREDIRVTEHYFENHPFFDVYAYGRIIEKYMDNEQYRASMGDGLWECLQYLGKACRQFNPDDRPDPLNLYVFLKEIQGHFDN